MSAFPRYTADQPVPHDLTPEERILNRDLSWLEFNRRVLMTGLDPSFPLLERAKFMAIFTSNLDEFYMKRVGLMLRHRRAGIDDRSPDKLTPAQRLEQVREKVIELERIQTEGFLDQIVPALGEAGIKILRLDELTHEERSRVDAWYQSNVFPILTPLAVDPGHRFPFISNLSTNLGLLISEPGSAERHFARVKIPNVLPQFVRIPPGPETPADETPDRFILLEELIAADLGDLFPGMIVHELLPFRVTRNASLAGDDDDVEDLLSHVEAELRRRRFASVVRLEVSPNPPQAVLDLLVQELDLEPDQIYERPGPLDYTCLFELTELDHPDLKHRAWVPVAPPALADDEIDMFSVIREHDILLHHPYESFKASVERFVQAAARDPHVLAIKQTIYRTSRDSPFVGALIRAAEAGKQVACLVELRARFDEHKNVRFARQLEKHGVHVAYGVIGYKTHCKCSLVVRKEHDGLRSYAHIGTGNYNPQTAQLYTDLGLLTCDPRITRDVVTLFNELTGLTHERHYDELIIAPFDLRKRLYDYIDREIEIAQGGGNGRIVAKMNSLEDVRITNKLYEASQAGVQIDLIVRGFCCLRPGVPGLSDNIRVTSIIGRFLEHSRIFHFADGHDDPLEGHWYIGSADWMARNLSGRMEAAVPVLDRAARQELLTLFEMSQRDRTRAWTLNQDGTYTKLAPLEDDPEGGPERLGTFVSLMNLARSRSVPAS